MQKAIIYRNQLLPPSETFIQAQAEALRTYEPIFAGLQRVSRSLLIPDTSIVAVPYGSYFSSLRRKVYRMSGFAPSFYSALKKVRPSVIHAHFGPDGAEAVKLATFLNVPLIVTLHGYDVTMSDSHHAESGLGQLYLRRRPKLWERASLFICVSNFIHKKALDAGFPADKLHTHYIGIDRSKFTYQPSQSTNCQIIFVGRLVEKKGCEYLLRAMRIVQNQQNAAGLVIIGDGPLKRSMQGLAEQLDIKCSFLGQQTSAQIAAHLRKSSIFCVPSVTATTGDSEGLGMVFLEAQAIGLPVVSFYHGGIPEAVQDKITGLLGTEKDVKRLAENLLTLIASPELRQKFGSNGVAWVAEQFDIDKQTKKLEALYQHVGT